MKTDFKTFNRCKRCSRKLRDPKAQYGWRCAEILGVEEHLNYAGDMAFSNYMSGIEKANEFLNIYRINTSEIDLLKFYESYAKLYLAIGIKDQQLFDLAYTDLLDALSLKHDQYGIYMPPKSPDLANYLNASDIVEIKNGEYSTASFINRTHDQNVAFLQDYLNQLGIGNHFNRELVVDGIYGPRTEWSLSNLPELVAYGKQITLSVISSQEDISIPNWDKEHLNSTGLQTLRELERQWQDARRIGDINGMNTARETAKEIRSRYLMPYQYIDSSGIVRVDHNRYNQFNEMAMLKNGTSANGVPNYVVAGAIASQLDSPAPGPADAVGIIIIVGGYLISQAKAYFAKGKSNPRDLEKGMSARQKEKFQREIEDYKKGGGMPPNFNIPWEILVEIAKEIKKIYK